MRVKRGKDWEKFSDWRTDYHYGIPGYGYIRYCDSSSVGDMASVIWDREYGTTWGWNYRIGMDGKYDLLRVDNQGR